VSETWLDVMTALRGPRLALLDEAHRGELYGIPAAKRDIAEWLLARHLLREVSPGIYRARATLEAAELFAKYPPKPIALSTTPAPTPSAPLAINTPPREIRVHTHQLAFLD
jgi:hypothetical protein